MINVPPDLMVANDWHNESRDDRPRTHTYVPNQYRPACRCEYPCIVCGLPQSDPAHA